MKTYIIFVEDRSEVENTIFMVDAEHEEEARNKFVKAYTPYIKELSWSQLSEILNSIDIYINIAELTNSIRL